MGNQTRPRIGHYGWPGTPSSATLGLSVNEGGCGEMPHNARGRPMYIDEALRNHCHIPARAYIVVAIGGPDYDVRLLKSEGCPPELLGFVDTKPLEEHIHKLKSTSQFTELFPSAGIAGLAGNASHCMPDIPKRAGDYVQYHQTSLNEVEPDGYSKSRKRPRRTSAPYDDVPGPEVRSISPAQKGRSIRIEDSKAIWDYYEQQFKNCQQTACKLIAKAWVKAVEPKKQSTHPYTGQEGTVPDWWPKPWGSSKDDRVRHKEPDHLYKRERVHLLCHILRLVIEKNPTINKVSLNVKKLDEITMEALSAFFADKDNSNNEKKRRYLKDIFKLARHEERFKRGECDPSLSVHVRPEDRAGGEEDLPSQNDDDHPDYSAPSETSKQHGPPQIMVSHDVQLNGQGGDRSSFSEANFYGGQPRYHPNGVIDGTGVSTAAILAHEGLGMQEDLIYSGSQGPTRRNSAYQASSTAFTSPTTPVTSWYTTTTSNPPPAMYSIHTNVPHMHSQQTVPMSNDLLMDDFSRNFGHQSAHGEALHGTTLGGMSLAQQAAYPNYSPHQGHVLAEPMKLETHHPGLPQFSTGR